LVVNNLSARAQAVELDLSRFEGSVLVEMLGDEPFFTVTNRPYGLTLPPYGFLWFRIEGRGKSIAPPDDPLPMSVRSPA
ncbi:MAG: alpha-glucosidase C-terminal domain-containing protein, partial [Polyangiales bacterium]